MRRFTHEEEGVAEYHKLLELVAGRNIMLEEYARTQIAAEDAHLADLGKMLRKPGSIAWHPRARVSLKREARPCGRRRRLQPRVLLAQGVHYFTSRQVRCAYTARPDRPTDCKIMELIIGSLVMAACLLIGHLSVLVRNRLRFLLQAPPR